MARRSKRNSTGWWIAVGAIGVLTAFGIFTLLSVRFGGGEGYPNYSTLRADPLGTRALYEALDRLPKVEGVRNFERLDKLDEKAGDVLMLLNVSVRTFNRDGDTLDGQVIARWAAAGGRVVIAMDPASGDERSENLFEQSIREVEEERLKEREKEKKEKDQKKAEKDGTKQESPEGDDKEKKPAKRKSKDTKTSVRGPREMALAEALKASMQGHRFAYTSGGGTHLEPTSELALAPEDVPEWYSSIFINDDPKQKWRELSETHSERRPGNKKKTEDPSPKDGDTDDSKDKTEPVKASAWKLMAQRNGHAMIMEKKLGRGSIVLCTDSYFASNEALWKDPKTKFLSWLVGDAQRVIFDETHLGASIGDEDNMMALARRYRMHGFFIGALLLFGLYVWRNAMSLVPPDAAQDLGHWREDAIAGQSVATGLEGLLRRGVPRTGVLSRCFDTWDKTPAAANVVPEERRQKARVALTELAGVKHAATAYRRLRDILHPARH